MRWSWGGKSADKAVCAAESLALSGRQRGRSSRRGQPGRDAGVVASGRWCLPEVVRPAPMPRCRG